MVKLYKGCIYILFVLLILFIIFIIDNSLENKKINGLIDDFTSRGVMVEEIDNYTYYKVTKKYEYEDCSNICDSYLDINIGTIGDIYISNRDPLGGFFVTEWISRFSWIGHAGLITSYNGDKMVEIVGNESFKENVVKINDNNWMKIDSDKHIVLRVKNISNTDKEKIVEKSNETLGCRYDYTFMFGGNKRFYCTNLVSYIYKKIDVDLNRDNLFTTGSDMISNDNTYIIYYKERYIKNNKVCYNIYYLDGE